MSFTNDLFIAVYTEDLLGDFYDNYKNNKWFSKEPNGEFKRISIPSKINKDSFETYWKSLRGDKDLTIYKFNNESTFTLIMYNSTDVDSLLCKEIVLKQYSSVYNRNIENWKEDGIVIYDVSSKKTDYPTYKDTNIFYPEFLDDTDVDEVFICGYSNIDASLIQQFMNCNEKLYIFENNQYKIFTLQSLLKTNFKGQFCGTRIKSKACQAFSFFRDPVENIKPADSKAFKAVTDYSDLICFNFTSLDKWKEIERIKKNFDEKISDETFRKSFVNLLFGEEVELDIDSLYEDVETNNGFEDVLAKYPLTWSNNVLALNTMEIPSVEQIEELVSINQDYSMVITFCKGDNDFWTVRAYRTPRELDGISLNKASDNTIYYLENGRTIKRITTSNGDKLLSVDWYYASSNNLVNANVFTEDLEGEYVLKNTKEYEKFNEDKIYSVDEYVFDKNNVKRFKLTNSNFLTIYPDNTTIKFNAVSLSNLMGTKYLCKGNAFIIEMTMTDKQFYSILSSKSLY